MSLSSRPSGSETRQRHVSHPVRMTPEESEIVKQKARDAGLSVSAFFRETALGRKTRSITDDVMINELRKLGGLLKNQFNVSGGQYSKESAETLRQITQAISRLGKLDEDQ